MFSYDQKFYKNKKKQIKKLKKSLINYFNNFEKKIKKKRSITFLHSGHLGDLINSLPVVKEISKRVKCSFLININPKLNHQNVYSSNASKNVHLTKDAFDKIGPLLKSQTYISKVDIFKRQKIDINLDFFRQLPINFNVDSVSLYSHLTGVFPDLSKPYLLNIKKKTKYKKNIIIMMSLRRQNKHLNYSFLQKYKSIIFIGLYAEYLDIKRQIKNLKFYNCKNFLEMAEIINSCKLFIGNLSFGFTIAEALKAPILNLI